MTIERAQPMLLPSEALPALVERACALLRLHQPEGDYYGAFSGGKDSCVIKELARLAGVRVTWHYNVTTIDARSTLVLRGVQGEPVPAWRRDDFRRARGRESTTEGSMERGHNPQTHPDLGGIANHRMVRRRRVGVHPVARTRILLALR